MDSPERVLVAGDVHGNTQWWLTHILEAAQRHDCTHILQVGDFGIWPGEAGQRYLDVLDRALGDAALMCWFIDGNHEDFDQLLAIPLAAHGRREVRPHIHHLPRGYRWSWGGMTFLAAGGAVSIDQALRKPGITWWPQEAVTEADVDAGSAGGSIDVLVAHDGPLDLTLDRFGRVPPTLIDKILRSRANLQRIIEATQPWMMVHGHWHKGYRRVVTRRNGATYTVVGLTCDADASGDVNGHCAVIDLTRLADDRAEALTVVD